MNGGLFNINGAELVVILLVVALVVGPDRLPEHARQLGQFVRAVRDQVRAVRSRVDEEVQAELGDVDWAALDPRRYDPRRIVREALLDEPADARGRDTDRRTVTGRDAAGSGAAPGGGGGTARTVAPVATEPLAAGEPAPYDDEAT